MIFLYNLLVIIAIVLYVPVLCIKGKMHRTFFMRLGFVPEEIVSASGKTLWVHAVSVGEVVAVSGLIKRIRGFCPEARIVVTIVTQTGYQLARSVVKGDNTAVLYAPLDLSFAVGRYIKTLNPVAYISTETEIWPNLFLSLKANNVPIFLINGRISAKSFAGYQRLLFVFKQVFACITAYCMQSAQDAQRIVELGAQKDTVHVVGNLKFDIEDTAQITTAVNLSDPNELVWIAGSTHPKEEEIILSIYTRLLQGAPNLRLIIAPRHVERAQEIQRLVESSGFTARFFSKNQGAVLKAGEIIVVDTIGQLRSLYSFADIVFVGKSLVGCGGQNIIEPAVYAKPIVIGPNMQNFKDVTKLFVDNDAVVQVRDAEELYQQMTELITDRQRMCDIGQRAKQVVAMNAGATDKTMDVIVPFLR